MESKSKPFWRTVPKEAASNYDELLMHHSLLFSDSLKDLKNLRKQLHSAADHFELSYFQHNQQQLVVETLKDYMNSAIISTVDHLGSVAYKMNEFLDDKAEEVSTAELHVSCLEQRLRTDQKFIDWSGFSQQSFLIKTPKYHKQCIIPGKKHFIGKVESFASCSPFVKERDSNPSKNSTRLELRSPLLRKGRPILPSLGASSSPGTFSFARIDSNKSLEKRSVSALRFPLKRSGSSRATQEYPLEVKKSVSLRTHAQEIQPYSKKSKPLFKSLITMYKQRKDERL